MATPTRQLLRKVASKRLKEESNFDSNEEDDLLEELSKLINANFPWLDPRTVMAETKTNLLEPLLEVSKKTKSYDPKTGPTDAARVIFHKDLRFEVYVFCEAFEEGHMGAISEVTELDILKKLNDSRYYVCTGINGYCSFKNAIGYDPKSVAIPVSGLPLDTVRHVKCDKICDRLRDGYTASICGNCRTLRSYLTTQKRSHSHDEAAHSSHQESSSSFPFEFLSPSSKRAKLTNIRKENKKLKVMLARLQSCKDQHTLDLNHEQSNEFAQLVSAISSSEVGRNELDKIYSEAAGCSEEGSLYLRSIWEDDVSDVEQFNKDQFHNSKYSCIWPVMLSIYVTHN